MNTTWIYLHYVLGQAKLINDLKKNQNRGCLGMDTAWKRQEGTFWGWNCSVLIGVWVTRVHVFVKTHRTTRYFTVLFPSLGFLCSLAVKLGRVALPTPTRPLSGMGNEGGSHRWTTGRRGAAVSCPLGF